MPNINRRLEFVLSEIINVRCSAGVGRRWKTFQMEENATQSTVWCTQSKFFMFKLKFRPISVEETNARLTLSYSLAGINDSWLFVIFPLQHVFTMDPTNVENGRGKVPHDPSFPFASTFSGMSRVVLPVFLHDFSQFQREICVALNNIIVKNIKYWVLW